MLSSLSWPAGLMARQADSAVVQGILDGPELSIERRQAHLRETAFLPGLVRTGNSRGQLGFSGGAAGRLNRFTQRRLGSSCFLLGAGQILVSGPLNGCTRVRLSSQGKVLHQASLMAGDDVAILRGPLFRDFSAPLPDRPPPEPFLHRRFPAEFPATARETVSSDPLVARINRIRGQGGRPALQPLPPALAARNAAYLAPVLQGILNSTDCDHDRSRWQAFQRRMASTAKLMPTSEVIACPMPVGSWNPERVVSRWMGSPLHTRILIDRPRARAIDCVRLVRSGRAAAICTLWSPVTAGSP